MAKFFRFIVAYFVFVYFLTTAYHKMRLLITCFSSACHKGMLNRHDMNSIFALISKLHPSQFQKKERLFHLMLPTDRGAMPVFFDTGSKWYTKFIEKLGLSKTTLHGLRHFGASYLISLGFDPESIRRQLGHANISTSFTFYAHSFKAYDERPAKALEALMHKEE